MFKKFFKDLVIIFTIVVVFTMGLTSSIFAAVNAPYKPIYNVTKDDEGVNKFTSNFPGLSPLIYNGGDVGGASCNGDSCDSSVSGDLAIELSNPFCIAYIALFSLAMYAGNATVKAAAVTSLIGAAAIIYAVAAFKLQDFEICGADWYVWGSEGTEEMDDAGALGNFNKYYPSFGPYNGSRKYAIVNCMKNISTCTTACKKAQENCKKKYGLGAGEGAAAGAAAGAAGGVIGAGVGAAVGAVTGAILETKLQTCMAESCVLNLAFMEKQGRTYLTINDKAYRERMYDGEEVKSPDCKDPRPERKNYDVGGDEQLYYMRGFNPGNYACDRFLEFKKSDGDEYDQAYKCCIESSAKVCVKDKFLADAREPEVFFCNTGNGKLCTHDAFILQVNGSGDADNEYCVTTWSLCPYNFNLQKGTTRKLNFKKNVNGNGTVNDECAEADSDGNVFSLSCQGKIKNFYQYKRHCATVEKWIPREKDDTDYPPFIDKACINFIGSSHNTEGYKKYSGYYRMFSTYRSFTAPIAECISETLKNFLFNRAGHTKCLNSGELPDDSGKCIGDIVYNEGDDLRYMQGRIPPSSKLLMNIKNIIMLMLVLMVVLYGYNILINSGKMDRKDMMIAMLKVVIVITFSSGSWWYDQLFRFTYGFSNSFSAITSKIGFDDTQDGEGNYIKYDGCYFGNINDILGSNPGSSTINTDNKGYMENNYYLYPANRRYVAFFDSLDCKIKKYLGYGSEGEAIVDIIRIIATSLIWPFGQLNIYFGVATLMLGLFVINFAIKAVYIFVASAIALAIMLYLAPLAIPCILFKKTKGIFDKWLKNIISFALQPMVLFAFVSMSLMIMDKYTLGEGIYSGTKLNRDLICGYACVDSGSGSIIKYTNNRGGSAYQNFASVCGDNDIVDLKRGSVLCFLNNQTTTPLEILQAIGIFIPRLIDAVLSDAISFLRVAFLFFILTKVLNTIPAIAGNLTGGTPLPGTNAGDPFEMGSKIAKIMMTVRRGAKNAAQKISKAVDGDKEDENDGKKEEGGGEDGGGKGEGGKMTGVSVRSKGQQGGSHE